MLKVKKINNTLIVLGTALAVLIMFKFKNHPYLSVYTVIAASLIYLLWALIYHKLDKSLTLAVILEYVLTALLVLILLSGFLV